MIFDIDGVKLQFIPDVHLGKVFKIGVPTNRLGDRENMVWALFEKSLQPQYGVKGVIQVGDIFDKERVDLDAVWRAADLIIAAAGANDIPYCFLRGNHDASKESKRKSSFDLLAPNGFSGPYS